jgi:hypothetical protein
MSPTIPRSGAGSVSQRYGSAALLSDYGSSVILFGYLLHLLAVQSRAGAAADSAAPAGRPVLSHRPAD